MYSLTAAIVSAFPDNLLNNDIIPGNLPSSYTTNLWIIPISICKYKNTLLFYLKEREKSIFIYFTHQLPFISIFLFIAKFLETFLTYLKSLILLNSISLKFTEPGFAYPASPKNLQKKSYNMLDNVVLGILKI